MGSRPTRVAVVQLAYHPAILASRRLPREDPLFTAAGGDSLQAPGKELPESFTPRLSALRRRIREAYDAHLLLRVKAILEACRGWGAEIVVFPEYSIPWEILGEVADAAGDMVVVAGTHTVEREAKKKEGLYQRLGLPAEVMPARGQSVAPVLHEGRLLALSAKLNPSQLEPQMKPGTGWALVEMPGDIPGPMGVVVCLDFLFRESDAHRALVAEEMARCRFLAVPSLTPVHSLPEFGGKAWEEARRYGRPVLYCNGSKGAGGGGGSSIYVDEGHTTDLKRFPDHAGWLDAEDEGVIVADIDLGDERPGTSTRYAGSRPVIPVAAATLVYRATPAGDAYASWLDAAGPLLARDDDDAVEALSAHVTSGDKVLQEAVALPGGAARARRLSQLRHDIERVNHVEEIRQLTREVVLPAGVLPLAGVRAGLARGAAEEMQRWMTEPGGGSFGTVVEGLLDGAAEHERMGGPWTEEGQRAIGEVSTRVRGGKKEPNRHALLRHVKVLEEEVEQGFEDDNKKAAERFCEARYSEAQEAYQSLLARAERTAQHAEAADQPRLRRWVERCKLNVAITALNLQELDEARALLLAVDPDKLPAYGRLDLVAALALCGEREKAEALLPDESELEEADRAKLNEVRQLFELLDGRVPDQLIDAPDIYVQAARLRLAQGDLATAAELAAHASDRARNLLFLAFTVMIIVEALRRTVNEVDPRTTPIPVEDRGVLAEEMEEYFAHPPAREYLPARVRDGMRMFERTFRELVEDADAPYDAATLTDRTDLEDPIKHAIQLALEGRVDEAILAIPPDPNHHPWLGRLGRAQMLGVAGRFERALSDALALAREFPDRAPIEILIAKLHAKLGHPADALAHARSAYKQFPARGYRLLLAGFLLDDGQPLEAWGLVKELNVDNPRVLRLRIAAAERTGNLEEAERAYCRYVELRPHDADDRVRYAQLLWRMGRPEEAATLAWKVYEEQRGELDAESLTAVGWLQGMTSSLAASDVRRRISDVASHMPETADQELRRSYLLRMASDEPGPRRDPEAFEQQRALIEQMKHLALHGAVPIVTLAATTGMPVSVFVTHLLEHSRNAFRGLSPPISSSDVPLPLELRGAKILVSNLELVLLEALDLTEALHAALGPEGRIVILQRSLDRLHGEESDLHIDTAYGKLEREDTLLREVERLPEVPASAEAAVVGEEPAHGRVLVPRDAFLGHLHAIGGLDANQYAALISDVSGGVKQAERLTSLPDRMVIGWALASKLFHLGALLPVFGALSGRLFLDAEAKALFRQEHDKALVKMRAAPLAKRVHQLQAKSWIEKDMSKLPAVDLPPLRDPGQPFGRQLFVEPLEEMVEHRQMMLKNRSWWWLSAEIYRSMALGVLELVLQFAWPSEDAYRAFGARLEDAMKRDITFPALIRRLDLGEKGAELRLIRLAELGFADALGAQEIIALMRRYGDLEGAEPTRILDAQEWMAREPGHHGGSIARQRLAYAYAAAIFNAFLVMDLSKAQSVLRTLLQRQEIIAKQSMENTLDQTFAVLASATADEWQRAWRPHESGGGVMSPESAIASLWRALDAWMGPDGSRRAAHGRALREIWRARSQRPGGPSLGEMLTLELANQPIRAENAETTSLPPELDAQLILSALWDQSPFEDGVFAEVFENGVASLANEVQLLYGRYPLIVGEGNVATSLPVPVEALLLRVKNSEARKNAAGRLKGQQGRYDGISYDLLEAIERAPDDKNALSSYAEHASTAFFRLVQDDPTFLTIWARARRVGEAGGQHPVDELLKILSEPAGLLPQRPLEALLLERLEPPGHWSNRDDRWELFLLATELPGSLPGYATSAWLEDDDYPERVESSLYHLDHSDEVPIARVVRAVLFLRVAATRRPLVKLPEGKVDLREILPNRLERLVEKVSETPATDTYAATEGTLLRVCGNVIRRFFHPLLPPLRYELWLTWRLFQWLCLQLDAISPDARRDGIQRLVRHDPGAQVRRDVLDPFGFGREPTRFDHRLGAVLHALAAMEELVVVFFRQQQPTSEAIKPRSVSSPGLEDRLLDLARRVHTEPPVGSVLDWSAPDNVPDLALQALLHLNVERFAELTPEARSRRFTALPPDPSTLQDRNPTAFTSATTMLLAAASLASKLTPDERSLLEAKLRSMVDSQASRFWRWITFVGLFEAGAAHLEDEALSLAVEYVKSEMAPTLAGWLLLGIAKRDLSRVEPALEAVLAAAEASGADAVGIATGLARLLVHGAPEARRVAGDIFLRLAERPSFGEDPRMGEVIGLFRLREPQG